jgi:peptide/nickel transport system permease protein
MEFIEAAHAVGFRNLRIIFREVLPNGLAPLIVTFTLNFGVMVISAASLSYMGFGIPVPLPEWGSMIATGRDFARTAPYTMLFPGVFIMLTVLAFNLIGDGLRDALDPKLKGRR